jgi:hypothetical protein
VADGAWKCCGAEEKSEVGAWRVNRLNADILVSVPLHCYDGDPQPFYPDEDCVGGLPTNSPLGGRSDLGKRGTVLSAVFCSVAAYVSE